MRQFAGFAEYLYRRNQRYLSLAMPLHCVCGSEFYEANQNPNDNIVGKLAPTLNQ